MDDFSTEMPESKPAIHYETHMDEIFCSEPEKIKRPIGYEVYTVKPGRPIVARLLGQAVGCYTHFIQDDQGKKTRLCYPPMGCPYCNRFQRRWNGYVPALLRLLDPDVRWISRTLHISHMAFESLRGKELRGMLIRLSRKDRRPNSELMIKIEEPAQSLPGLPPEWDVRTILKRMFGVESLGEQNHVLAFNHR